MAFVGSLDFEKPIDGIEQKIAELFKVTQEKGIDFSKEIEALEIRATEIKKQIFSNLTPWQKVLIARHLNRPSTVDYIRKIFSEFVELSGDRLFRDDKALVGGIAKLDENKVLVIGHRKGKDTKSNLEYNFGMPHPEGYRKTVRLAQIAEKFSKPLITFIDTPGAYPGIGAEERGQGEAIARSLQVFSRLTVPIIVVIIGEGGSGGALAIGVGDRILMLEHAVYSVISPEGCAAILWNNQSKVKEAAKNLSLTSDNLMKLKVIDEIIKEPIGGAHRNPEEIFNSVKLSILNNLRELQKIPVSKLVLERYQRLRKIGKFIE
ncbi:acetyl-CoA carboxylase carboxyltransferase subunit alpha [bacterium]|nr:acetyl-CoA carboxylase carboxyltransferase subunit alpha [bacterium]MBU1153080.1 acetyl-CoA carboxylase carboxyltransferase subunit alpha [bacterium]MBU1782939.1 acetyl-CoA carboxylase carboxyltransferase subunit alpha [bacterium]MBU2599885.1 acetyl-CoA carboxylase carboxyltransferase subunit alpha [bacterium]